MDDVTIRKCSRRLPVHWHVDFGEMDIECATEEEAEREAARLRDVPFDIMEAGHRLTGDHIRRYVADED